MRVPPTEGDFDKTNIMLDQTAGQQTPLSKTIVAVSFPHRGRLLTQIEGFQIFALHQSQGIVIHVLVGPDIFLIVLLVEGFVELLGQHQAVVKFLLTDAHAAVLDAFSGAAQHERRVLRLHKSGSAAVGTAANAHTAGQGAVGAPFMLLNPCSQPRMGNGAAHGIAGVHVIIPLLMRALCRADPAHQRGHIHFFGQTGHVLGEENAIGRGTDRFHRTRHLTGFGIEGIDMRHAA